MEMPYTRDERNVDPNWKRLSQDFTRIESVQRRLSRYGADPGNLSQILNIIKEETLSDLSRMNLSLKKNNNQKKPNN